MFICCCVLTAPTTTLTASAVALVDNVATTPARVFDLKINSKPTSVSVDGMRVARQPQPNPLLDNVEALALGEHLPGGRRQLYLMSDDNNGATQITRFYSLAVDMH